MVECGGRTFENFEDVDRAGHAFWAAIPPQQRLDLMLELNARHWERLGYPLTHFERVIRITRRGEE